MTTNEAVITFIVVWIVGIIAIIWMIKMLGKVKEMRENEEEWVRNLRVGLKEIKVSKPTKREKLRRWFITKLGGYWDIPKEPEHSRYLALFVDDKEVNGQGYHRAPVQRFVWESEKVTDWSLKKILVLERPQNIGVTLMALECLKLKRAIIKCSKKDL